MSKLDELIRELCPDGVEYKKLGEIATVLRGASPRPIKKYITNDSDGVNWIKIGDVPVGSKYITQSEEKITKEGAEKSRYVQKGDFILSNSMSFGRPYILAIDGCIHDGWLSISNFKDVFLSDYLYYLLSSSAIQQEMKKRASFGGAVQNLNADIVKALVLPVPPIEVQSEIVRMLDSYTESVVELQRQLTAELTARKAQYSYYRDKLLQYETIIEELEIGEDGVIPSATFNVGDGTKYGTQDTKEARRGNSYYFTYKVYLDLNHDGTGETEWPLPADNVTLTSSTMTPQKQAPRIIMYPSTSTENTITYTYKCSDIDNALEKDEFIAYINSSNKKDVKAINTQNSFSEITFENLIAGNLDIKVSERVIKSNEAVEKTLAYQYFEGKIDISDLTYRVDLEENSVNLTVSGDEDKISKITALKSNI